MTLRAQMKETPQSSPTSVRAGSASGTGGLFARHALRGALLLATFIAAFSLSLYAFLRGSLFIEAGAAWSGASEAPTAPEEDRFFPAAASIRTAGDFLAIAHHESLDPIQGEDFFVFGWVKLRRALKDREESVFLAKIAGDGNSAHGYSLGLAKIRNVLRPTVFWRDRAGKGRTYLFTELDLLPKQWVMLLLGYRERILTVSSITIGVDGSLRTTFHGSQQVDEDSTLPLNNADLVLGAKRNGNFRGHLGPFGLLSGTGLLERSPELLKLLGTAPRNPPQNFRSALKLFVPETTADLSANAHEVRVRGIPEFAAKKGKGKS